MKIGRARILLFGALAAGLTAYFGIHVISGHGSIAGHTVPLKEPIPAYTRSLRPNYPYSIIPGGAYSPAELRYADQEDDVVKAHYADFNVKNAQMVQLTEDRYQYVSYRLKKKVFWTKKKLRIPKGEVLLTDGSSWARARCGNRLSDRPHLQQVSDEEPPVKALAIPPMRPGEPMELAEAPPLGELSTIIPGDISRFPPVLPPTNNTIPPEFPPLVPVIPVTPMVPVIPPLFPPTVTTPTPPGTPPLTPTPPLIPPDNPPVTPVPEPKAVYLFLVTFILSLYALTRMMPPPEKDEARNEG